MNRKDFLQAISALPIAGQAMGLGELNKMLGSKTDDATMPLLFLGHGSPMNAIEENEFVTGWRTMGKDLPKPTAVLCISAHWETRGTYVTAMEHPRTIHDFGGFPQALFNVEYPAPGSPAVAKQVQSAIQTTPVGLDDSWGLDHGSWSVVKHLYPAADVPVLQMSLDRNQPPAYHYALAKELSLLRKKGVLIVGSGNIVHNLGVLNWQKPDSAFDWAQEANNTIRTLVEKGDHAPLINYHSLGKSVAMAIPTPEHFLPFLYILGLKSAQEQVTFFNDKTVMGSIAMTSLKIA